MSHFAVLVVGENPKEQLYPFRESLQVEWKDLSEEYLHEYNTQEAYDFYCSSSSSWGVRVDKGVFDFLINNKIGDTTQFIKLKDSGNYLKLNKKYRGYFELEGKRSEGDA